MKEQVKASPKLLEPDHIDRIYGFLAQFQMADKAVKEEHVSRIKGKRG